MPGFNEVDNLDSLNAWATNIKLQVEACSQVLRHPTKCKSRDDFTEILRKIGMDFIIDANVRRLIFDIANVIEKSNMKKDDLDKLSNQWRLIDEEMSIEVPILLRENLGLKLASLSYIAGPKAQKTAYSLSKAIGVNHANSGEHS